MSKPELPSLHWWVVAVVALSACGVQPTAAPSASGGSSSDVGTTAILESTTTAPSATTPRHLTHDALSAALPTAAQLGWLPSGVKTADDNDLTTHLRIPDCAGHATPLPSRESSATNRGYDLAGQRLAEVTYYDVETIEGAHQYLTALDGYFTCPTPVNTAVTQALITMDDVTATKCDEAVLVRTHQPVSQTVDEWCRVGNLIAWIRLYPTGSDTGTGVAAPGDTGLVPAPDDNLTPPTDENAKQTISVVGEHLRAAFDAAA